MRRLELEDRATGAEPTAGRRAEPRPSACRSGGPAELHRLTRNRRPEHDVPAVRMTARGRVVVATGAVIAASLVLASGGQGDRLLYVLGAWVSWSGWLALEADVKAPRFIRVCGAAGDVVVLAAAAALFPGAAVAVGLGALIVVLVGAYTGGAGEGAVLSLVAVAIVASVADPAVPTALLFTAVLTVLVVVVERGSSQQRQASRQSERFLGRSGAILERVADGVMVTDVRGAVLEANPAARRIMNAVDGAVESRHCNEVLSLGIGERVLDCTGGCALLRSGNSSEGPGQEVWCLSPDGRRRPLLANAGAITNQDGAVDEVVHSLRDITSLKQADEAKTLFLATTSHELKTPLTVIRGFGELLAEGPDLPVDTRVKAAEAIVRRADELATIVDGLLISSRIESGRLKLELSAVAVAPILQERGRSLGDATGRPVDVVVDPELPDVEADTAAVTTLVDHLLDNAVKYSPAGGKVTLTATVDQDEVRISVSDTGVGMDPEQVSHCFEKFWQAESGDDRRFKGSGIGLYIVGSLAEAMAGRMEVQSTAGLGSTFTLVLPVAGATSAAATDAVDTTERGGDESIVREFMRQLGIPAEA